MDWTIAADQPLLVVSLIVGRRAVPRYWRAYDASVLKGRMKRYELAVIRRAVGRVVQAVGKRRVVVTADRGFADVALFTFEFITIYGLWYAVPPLKGSPT
jgi:hypothetical protein